MKTEAEIRTWLEANYPDGGWTLEGNYSLAWTDDTIAFRPGIEYIVGAIDAPPVVADDSE